MNSNTTISTWKLPLICSKSCTKKEEKKNPVSCVIDPGVFYVLSKGDVDWQDLEYASKTCVQTYNTPTD